MYCCGRQLTALKAIKDSEGTVKAERDGSEVIISGTHPMTREDYVSFVALVSTDTVLVRKLYPEWDLMLHLPRIPQALLYWYSAREGLHWSGI